MSGWYAGRTDLAKIVAVTGSSCRDPIKSPSTSGLMENLLYWITSQVVLRRFK